jgi:2-phospho-L-lactate transferase/gluconeogenesis factor (CofD/UPF0052 family)
VYVCNTATQPGETGGYNVRDHVLAIERHTRPGLFPIVLANSRQAGELLPGLEWVGNEPALNGQHRLLAADVAEAARPWRHDSTKLATALINLLNLAEADQPQPDSNIISKETWQ